LLFLSHFLLNSRFSFFSANKTELPQFCYSFFRSYRTNLPSSFNTIILTSLYIIQIYLCRFKVRFYTIISFFLKKLKYFNKSLNVKYHLFFCHIIILPSTYTFVICLRDRIWNYNSIQYWIENFRFKMTVIKLHCLSY